MQPLLAAARNGDEAAFVGMPAPLLEEAHRLGFAMLRNQHDAEDAVQEVSFKAWRAVGRLRDGSNPRPRFLTIVANECRQRRRGPWWNVIRGRPLGPAGGVAALTVGPDGALWFALSHGGGVSHAPPDGQLGRVALEGAVTLYGPQDAPAYGPGVAGPLVLGPDRNLWAFGSGTVTRIALS